MRVLILLLALASPALALDVVQNASGTSSVTCAAPTEYSDDTPVRDNDITIKLYMNGVEIQSSAECSFTLSHSLPVSTSNLHVTAYSAFYQSESLPSNTIQYNIFEPLVPNAPAQLNWEL